MSIKYKIFLNSVITALIGVSIMFIVGVCGVTVLNNRGNIVVGYLFLFGCVAVILGTIVGVFLNRKIVMALDELKKISQNIARSELDIEEKSIEEEIFGGDEFEDIKESLTKLSNEMNKGREYENVKLVFNEVNINEILYEIGNMFTKRSYEKNIEFKFDLSENPIYITVDVDCIKQVLTNIYHNAVKYSLNGGLISVRVSKASMEDICVYIKDNGIGISKKELLTIFEDKYVGEEDFEFVFGLSYSKKIMKAHGGDIFINSFEGEGTEVILQFKKNEDIKKDTQEIVKEFENENSEEGNNIHDALIEGCNIDLEQKKEEYNDEGEGDNMKNKKETGTLENNLSNNAMMMDHILGSTSSPFKNRKEEKRENSIIENESNIVEKEKAWTEEEEEEI